MRQRNVVLVAAHHIRSFIRASSHDRTAWWCMRSAPSFGVMLRDPFTSLLR